MLTESSEHIAAVERITGTKWSAPPMPLGKKDSLRHVLWESCAARCRLDSTFEPDGLTREEVLKRSTFVAPKSSAELAAERMAETQAEVALLASANAASLSNIARARAAVAGSKPATVAPTKAALWAKFATVPILEKRSYYEKNQRLMDS